MPSVTPDDLAQYLAKNFTGVQYDQAEAVINVVTAEVSAWTRGNGFVDGMPNSELWSVILGSASRRFSNPTNVVREEMGGLVVQHAPAGFSLTEQRILNRYREMAL
jgi:hypothetical protein